MNIVKVGADEGYSYEGFIRHLMNWQSLWSIGLSLQFCFFFVCATVPEIHSAQHLLLSQILATATEMQTKHSVQQYD